MNTNNSILIAVLIGLVVIGGLLTLAGCGTTQAHLSGRAATGAALLTFDDPKYEPVFVEAKRKIDAFLETKKAIEEKDVDAFIDWLAVELGKDKRVLKLFAADLKIFIESSEVETPGEIAPAIAFVEGVAETLALFYD